MTYHRIYLAGPMVFYVDRFDRFRDMKATLAKHGLLGVSPLDDLPNTDSPAEIRKHCLDLIETCHGVMADCTPWRGVSADVGTVYEIGYARALGIDVLSYTFDHRDYIERVGHLILPHRHEALDTEGRYVENFGLSDNLMLGEVARVSSFENAVIRYKSAFNPYWDFTS